MPPAAKTVCEYYIWESFPWQVPRAELLVKSRQTPILPNITRTQKSNIRAFSSLLSTNLTSTGVRYSELRRSRATSSDDRES